MALQVPLVPRKGNNEGVYIFSSGGHTYIGIDIDDDEYRNGFGRVYYHLRTFREVYEFQKVVAPTAAGHTVAVVMNLPHFNDLIGKPLSKMVVSNMDWFYKPSEPLLNKVRDYIVKEFRHPEPVKKQMKAVKKRKPKMVAKKKKRRKR